MKPIFLVLCISLFSTQILAQDETGRFFVETGFKFGASNNLVNFIGSTGIAYNNNKMVYYHPNNHTSENTRNTVGWSLAPRMGYQFKNLIAAGIELHHFRWNIEDYLNYRNYTAGVFIRKNFTSTIIRPFVEFSYGIGGSKEVTQNTAPSGGDYTRTINNDIHYFAGATGISFALNEKFALGLSATVRKTVEKDNYLEDLIGLDYKNSNIEMAPRFSVIYSFIPKKEK